MMDQRKPVTMVVYSRYSIPDGQTGVDDQVARVAAHAARLGMNVEGTRAERGVPHRRVGPSIRRGKPH